MKTHPILFAAASCLGLLLTSVAAQVPHLINYQGRVAVGAVNFEGVGQFKFALVNSDGSTSYWSNDGTSSSGSEPAAAVTLTVSKGLYSVLLGDTSVANMTAIPATVWANPDVRLRVWFNDGTHGSQLLTPDQRLAPSGYLADGSVSTAKLADGSVTAAKLADGAVGSTQLASGAVGNTNLANPSLTVAAGPGLSGGGAVALGSSVVLNNAGVLSLNGGGGVTVDAGTGTVTLGSNATSANSGGTIVARDPSGNFAAGTITASLNGNATSATSAAAATSAVSFTGGLNGDVTGTQGATAVQSVGGVAAASVASGAQMANAATDANTAGAIVKRDSNGNFSAGTVTATAFSGGGSGLTNLAGGNLQSASVALGAIALPARPKFDRQYVQTTSPQQIFMGAAVDIPGVTLTTKSLDESGTYSISFRASAYSTSSLIGNLTFYLSVNGVDVALVSATAPAVSTNGVGTVSMSYLAAGVSQGTVIKARCYNGGGASPINVNYCQLMIDGVPTSQVR